MKLWSGKSAAKAINIFLALREANIDGPEVKKVPSEGSPTFEVYADVTGDEEMEKSAKEIVLSAGSSIRG